MEPDFDKLVSNKIRNTERQPVSWNKEAVWTKLKSQTPVTRLYHFVYPAAAAVILLLFHVAIGPTNEAPATVVKVASREETRTAKQPVPPEDRPNAATANDNTRQDDKKNAVVRQVESPDKVKVSTPRGPKESTGTEVVVEPVITEDIDPLVVQSAPVIAAATEPAIVEETTSRREKIRPIVGVITESDWSNVANTKPNTPRFRLKARESLPDPVPRQDPRNPLVFAVNK